MFVQPLLSPNTMTERSIFKKLFLPHFDETSLFVMAISFLSLMFVSAELGGAVLKILIEGNLVTFCYTAIFFSGLLFAIYHFFSESKKSDWQKFVLLIFAIVSNVLAGWLAGWQYLESNTGLMRVFPLWNIVSAAILGILWHQDIVTEDNICDENAWSIAGLCVCVGVVITLLLITQFMYPMHWSVSYSICVFYATSLSHFVTDAMPPAKP